MKREKTDRGSILMETVLVIPLYLALLSGIFWVGDLALLRAKSTFFDRFSAWSSGNRHQRMEGEQSRNFLNGQFLKQSKIGDQTMDSVTAGGNASGNAWLSIFGASGVVSIRPPVWTDAWHRSALLMMEEEDNALQKESFRSREIDAKFPHRVIMREKDSFRENATPRSLAESKSWLHRVYDAPWPSEWTEVKNSTVSGASECRQYERHQAFVQWSE